MLGSGWIPEDALWEKPGVKGHSLFVGVRCPAGGRLVVPRARENNESD